MKLVTLFLFLLTSLPAYSYPKTPKIWQNPGRLCHTGDRDFDRFRYGERIPYCRRNVSRELKDEVCEDYDVYNRRGYTVDHIIPLSVGGSNHKENLWCQSRQIMSAELEFWLYEKVKYGDMTQAEAVHFIMKYKFNPKGKDRRPKPPNWLD